MTAKILLLTKKIKKKKLVWRDHLDNHDQKILSYQLRMGKGCQYSAFKVVFYFDFQ